MTKGKKMKAFILATTLLATSSWATTPCGLKGDVAQRISDCKETADARGEFQLVTRTAKGEEIYKGARTGVIWSADLISPKNYLSDKLDTICKKQHSELGGLKLNWILPPVERYIQALKYDIQSSLPGVSQREYWTSTADSFYVNSRYIFEGANTYKPDSKGRYTFRHLEIEDGHAYVKCIVETIQ